MLNEKKILSDHYGIQAISLERLPGGLIHKTFKVTSVSGDLFILQSVASIFKPKVMLDIKAILHHLRNAGLIAEDILCAKNGKMYVVDGPKFWRVFSYIEGQTFSEATEELAFEAGRLLGQYHITLAQIEHDFFHVREAKHNFEGIYKTFAGLVNTFNDEMKESAKPLHNMLNLLPPSSFRPHVTHGDPKLTNFIFSKTSPVEALAIIDLDDCGSQYNASVELAKALKSWATKTDSNDKVCVDMPIIKSAIAGYKSAAKSFLSSGELNWIPQGMKLLSLELAARFLIDVYEDSYFDWDKDNYVSRGEHNLARFQEQIDMYHALVESEKEIFELIIS